MKRIFKKCLKNWIVAHLLLTGGLWAAGSFPEDFSTGSFGGFHSATVVVWGHTGSPGGGMCDGDDDVVVVMITMVMITMVMMTMVTMMMVTMTMSTLLPHLLRPCREGSSCWSPMCSRNKQNNCSSPVDSEYDLNTTIIIFENAAWDETILWLSKGSLTASEGMARRLRKKGQGRAASSILETAEKLLKEKLHVKNHFVAPWSGMDGSMGGVR